jgi:colanic acid/amylovoran biosynthesis glycosyltransferase
MRIAIVLLYFPVLSETFILNQITGLINRGHEVDIYAYRPDPENFTKVHHEVEKYHLMDRTYYVPKWQRPKIYAVLKGLKLLFANLGKKPVVLLRSLNSFKYGKEALSMRLLYWAIPLLKKPPYDIIHCHFAMIGVEGVLLREIGAIEGKILTSFHGADVNSHPKLYGQNFYKPLFEKGDWFTSNTSFTAETAIKLGCPGEKISIHPEALDISLYSFEPRYLNPDESVKIITVARLVEKKGIEYAIAAVAKVLKTHPNIIYKIVGEGYLREPLEKLIAELDVADKVHLLGWMTQDEVRKLYADSHIFILSSVTAADGDKEGQGLVLQEAQAMGLPVLSTLHNGIPDGVLDGKSGFLVPEKDAGALAEKLTYLIENPEIVPKMGQAGRKFVEERYDVNKLNDRLVEIYEHLLAQSKPRTE